MPSARFLLSPIAVFCVSAFLPALLGGKPAASGCKAMPVVVGTPPVMTPAQATRGTLDALHSMEQRLGIALNNPSVTVQLCDNDTTYKGAGGLGNTDACFLAPGKIILRRAGSYKGDLSHEFAHVLIEQETDGTCPAWLEEGVINHENHVTATGQYDARTLDRLDRAMAALQRDPRPWSLTQLGDATQSSHFMDDGFYAASWSAADYLYHTYGRAAVLRALGRMGANDPNAAFRAETGRSLIEIERDWKATLH